MPTQAQPDFAQPLSNVTQAVTSTSEVSAVKNIQVNGAAVTTSPRSTLNFVATVGVTGTESSSTDTATITISTPGAQLDYAQITADVGGLNATTEGTSLTVISGNSITYDGTKVKIEVWAPAWDSTAGSAHGTGVLYRDSTVVGQWRCADGNRTGTPYNLFNPGVFFDTPSAAAHTYTWKVFVNAGTGAVKAGAGGSGAFVPAFLIVTKA